MKNMTGKATAAIAAVLLAGACAGKGPEKAPAKEFEPIILTKAEQEINAGVNRFGIEVFRQVAADAAQAGGDRGAAQPAYRQVLVSPLSLSLALSLTAQGASGATADQMTAALGFAGFTTEEVAGYYQKMTAALLEADPKTTLQIANAIWADSDIHLKKDFVTRSERYFGSQVTSADFASPATLKAINAWCASHTNDKIRSILDEMPDGMKMALLNALYFKGEWSGPFTRDGQFTFHAADGTEAKRDVMKRQDDYAYASSKDFQCVTLPYGNGSFVMDVILPRKGLSFTDALAAFDADAYAQLVASGSSEDVIVRMPPFKFDFETELTDLLAARMPAAFSNGADFSEMAKESLKIGLVKQKTFIEVNEKGTEAAAVTIVGMKLTSTAVPAPRQPIEFTADRPFLFAIRERSTGALLFLGQVVS